MSAIATVPLLIAIRASRSRRLLRDDVRSKHDGRPRSWSGWTICRLRSTSGVTRSLYGGWASSCWWSRDPALVGVGGMQVYKAETPGPIKDERSRRASRDGPGALVHLFMITAACIGLAQADGMNWFDAICHAFAAPVARGFSTYDASVGHFDSPAIEAVLIVFMLIAAMEFQPPFHRLAAKEPAHLPG